MDELGVVKRVHRFLENTNLRDRRVAQLYTDAHHTLLGEKELRPYQRFTLELGDRVAHPDLVAQLDDGETLLAVEAKGTSGITRGLAQAQQYQEGFHLSFLATDASAIGSSTERFARRKNVGLITVQEDVRVAHWPLPKQPWRDPARAILRQMEAAGEVSSQNTFLYNLPTHYLVWAIALAPDKWYEQKDLPGEIEKYPMPEEWMGALRGARKLGLIEESGNRVRLTPTGEAVQDILDTSVEAWTEVHERAKHKPLVDFKPQAAAALRLLIMQDSMTRLIIKGLRQFSDHRASFDELARKCSEIDYDRSSVLFFVPERIEDITNRKAEIDWGKVSSDHLRSTTSYQFKSVLKHAGVIEDTRLGKGKKPEDDIWVLR